MASSSPLPSSPRPEPPRAASAARRRRRGRVWLSIGIAVALLIAFVGIAGLFPNENARRSIERRMNASLKGYGAQIGKVRVRPFGLSVTLENLVIRQQAHPDPPVLDIPLMTASVHWRELLTLHVVADFFLDHPRVYANLTQLKTEAEDPTPVKEKGWQQAFEAIYPLKINQLRIREGNVTYIDTDPKKPLVLAHLNGRASNIRNIHSRARTYPSPLEASAVVFGKGRASIRGDADFLAEPYAGVKGHFRLASIPLDALGPVASHWNVELSGGTFSAQGDVEYAPKVRVLKLPDVTLEGVTLGYVRGGPAPPAPKTPPKPSDASAPKWDLALDHFRVARSRLELVDPTKTPHYRIFVSGVGGTVEGLANNPPGHLARATVRGKFMGDGDVSASASFRPGFQNADLDVKVHVAPTKLPLLNDLFRAYGKFDVAAGTLEVFAEAGIHDKYMRGHVKPIFKDLEVYDKNQEAQKPFFKKVYERAIDTASKLLKNRKHEQVATDTPIEGPVGGAKTSFWATLGGLLENAFVRAILPGFDREVGPLRRPT
ncbi:MAG: DUF748 domain-containing protein [Syntrophomonadaceae bacterium]